jgi:hypothetical protein
MVTTFYSPLKAYLYHGENLSKLVRSREQTKKFACIKTPSLELHRFTLAMYQREWLESSPWHRGDEASVIPLSYNLCVK